MVGGGSTPIWWLGAPWQSFRLRFWEAGSAPSPPKLGVDLSLRRALLYSKGGTNTFLAFFFGFGEISYFSIFCVFFFLAIFQVHVVFPTPFRTAPPRGPPPLQWEPRSRSEGRAEACLLGDDDFQADIDRRMKQQDCWPLRLISLVRRLLRLKSGMGL